MRAADVSLVVIAKAPVPGRCKTRLCPPLAHEQAAQLAEAALIDTQRAVAATPARRRVLALDGDPGRWAVPGFELVAQVSGGLGERLAGAFAEVGGPAVVVGMDTPQLTPARLEHAAAQLARPGVDAVLGPARDGGYWAIGLRAADPAVFEGVEMSSSRTGRMQHDRLRELGMSVVGLGVLRDVDTIEDAEAVAALCPRSCFAERLSQLRATAGAGLA